MRSTHLILKLFMLCNATCAMQQQAPSIREQLETVHTLAIVSWELHNAPDVHARNIQVICVVLGKIDSALERVQNRAEVVGGTLQAMGIPPDVFRRRVERAGVDSAVLPEWLGRQHKSRRGPTDATAQAVDVVAQVLAFAHILQNPSDSVIMGVYGSPEVAIQVAKEYLPQWLEKINQLDQETLTVACARNSVTRKYFAQVVTDACAQLACSTGQ